MTGPTSPGDPVLSVAVFSYEEIIGDGLYKLPFVRALRAAYPSARITWITARRGSDDVSTSESVRHWPRPNNGSPCAAINSVALCTYLSKPA